jgi:hypothetical protein
MRWEQANKRRAGDGVSWGAFAGLLLVAAVARGAGEESPMTRQTPPAVRMPPVRAAAAPAPRAPEPANNAGERAVDDFPQLHDAAAEVRRQLARLENAGDRETPRRMAAKLHEIEAEARGQYQVPPGAEMEAHLVYLDEGAPPPAGLIQGKERFTTGYAVVSVADVSQPVLLILQGRRPTHWRIAAEKGVRFAAVLLRGRDRQTVSGLPADVLVSDENPHGSETGMPSISGTANARSTVQSWVREQFGCDLGTALAPPNYAGEPIVVGPQNAAWRDQKLAQRAAQLLAEAQATARERQHAKVAKLRFRGTSYLPFAKAGQYFDGPEPTGVGEFTVRGAIVATLRPITKEVVDQVAVPTETGETTFALSRQGELVIVDTATEQNLPKAPHDRKLNPSGRVAHLAYDARHKRLVCVGNDRESNLLAYDLATAQWSSLGKLAPHVKGLIYASDKDQFLVVTCERPENEARRGAAAKIDSTLYVYDAAGREVRKQAIDLPIGSFAPNPYGDLPSVHLALADGLLVVQTPPQSYDARQLAGRIDVVDPNNGGLLYSGAPENVDDSEARSTDRGDDVRASAEVKSPIGKVLQRFASIEAEIAAKQRTGQGAQTEEAQRQLTALRASVVGGAETKSTEQGSGDLRLQQALPKLDALLAAVQTKRATGQRDALMDVRFHAQQKTKNSKGEVVAVSIAQFTPRGPIMYTLESISSKYPHVAWEAAGERMFAVSSHSVVSVHRSTAQETPMQFGPGLPNLSWPCGMTFDAKRRRVMLTSLGGEGFLYAYDLAADQWSLITSMKNKDMHGMTYDPDRDLLYGICDEYPGGQSLQTMTPQGVVLRRKPIDLGDAASEGGAWRQPGLEALQLAGGGGYMMVLRSETIDDAGKIVKPGRIRVYDPQTGKRVYSGTTKRHPGYRKLSKAEIEQAWQEMLDDDAKAADRAAWQLAAGREDAEQYVAKQLAQIKSKVNPAEVERLVKQLDADEFRAREDAQQKLAELGPDIEEELTKHAASASAEAKKRIGALLVRLSEPAKLDAESRRALLAVAVLKRTATSDSAAKLKNLAEGGPRLGLRRAAIEALTQLKSEQEDAKHEAAAEKSSAE